jgi:hypothetical protein
MQQSMSISRLIRNLFSVRLDGTPMIMITILE